MSASVKTPRKKVFTTFVNTRVDGIVGFYITLRNARKKFPEGILVPKLIHYKGVNLKLTVSNECLKIIQYRILGGLPVHSDDDLMKHSIITKINQIYRYDPKTYNEPYPILPSCRFIINSPIINADGSHEDFVNELFSYLVDKEVIVPEGVEYISPFWDDTIDTKPACS